MSPRSERGPTCPLFLPHNSLRSRKGEGREGQRGAAGPVKLESSSLGKKQGFPPSLEGLGSPSQTSSSHVPAGSRPSLALSSCPGSHGGPFWGGALDI